MKALRIDTNGQITELHLLTGNIDHLTHCIREAVGRSPAVHALGENLLLWLAWDTGPKSLPGNSPVRRILREMNVYWGSRVRGPVVITGGTKDAVRSISAEGEATVRPLIFEVITPPTGIRPVGGPQPEHVQDRSRGIRYPGQVRPNDSAWEQRGDAVVGFYAGKDIGAYRPTDTGYEERLGDWALDLKDDWNDDNTITTEQQARDMVLFNFNQYLRALPADDES